MSSVGAPGSAAAAAAAAAQATQQDGLNLKAAQTGVLHRLLRLQSGSSSGSDGLSSALDLGASWKLLIYDRYCQDILSPLLTVNELRALGITLHLSLHAARERVPDIPAVYFVRPTLENLALIARDVRAGLYDSTHINFSTSVPSGLLEQFAAMVLAEQPGPAQPLKAPAPALASGAAAASRIVQIRDQYCEFISLEERLFTLNHADSFARLNGPTSAAGEQDMFAHVEEMVSALFGVCVTAGVVPVIRAKAGHAAELVASKLDARLREHLSSRHNLFAGGSGGSAAAMGFHRPLLVLADRNVDLAAPLLHSWTYQALLHDLLHMTSNRVTVQVAEPAANGGAPGASKPRTYDLLSGEDKFWKHHAGKVFPKVAEGVTERLQAYQTEFNAVTKKAGSAAATGPVGMSAGSDDLASAINALPKLQRRKKLLDTHVNIATALLAEIKAREIDAFFDLEQSMGQKQTLDKQAVAAIFGGAAAAVQTASASAMPAEPAQGKGTLLDRLRFLLIYYLQGGLTDDQLAQYKQQLQTAAASGAGDPSLPELAALEYVQQYKMLHRLSSGEDLGASASSAKPKVGAAGASAAGGMGGMLGNFSKLADSLYGGGVGLLAGVRNLLPVSTHLPLTRVVEQLVLNRDGAERDALDAAYKYFDPKSSSGGGRRAQRPSGSYKEAVVFVLGGGSYSEYQNLQDWQKEASTAHGVASIVYGCSELVAPEQFVRQLAGMQQAAQQATRAHMPVD